MVAEHVQSFRERSSHSLVHSSLYRVICRKFGQVTGICISYYCRFYNKAVLITNNGCNYSRNFIKVRQLQEAT